MIINNLKKQIKPILIILVGFLIVFYLFSSKEDKKQITVIEKSWLVSVEKVVIIDQRPSIKLFGEIDSLWNTELVSSLKAEITDIHINDGDTVNKGDVLIYLNPIEAQLLLNQRQAELDEQLAKYEIEIIRHKANLRSLPEQQKRFDLAESEAKRLNKLYKKKISAGSLRDKARDTAHSQKINLVNQQRNIDEFKSKEKEIKARITKAEAIRDLAQLDLDRTIIKAPFDGKIKQISVSIGKRVRVGDPLVSLYDTNAMVIRTQIPDQYLSSLKVNSGKLIGTLDGINLEANLLNIMAEVKTGQASIEALFKLSKPNAALQKGRFIELSLELPIQKNVVSVPFSALYDSTKVFLVDTNNRLKVLIVKKVGKYKDMLEQSRFLIKSDSLKSGDRILTTQLPNAIDGLLVEIAP